MFTLKRENGAYRLYDKPSNSVVMGIDLYNLLFIAETVKKMREQIEQGNKDNGFFTDFTGSARRLGKNMQIIRGLVQKGLPQGGVITEMAAVMEIDPVCETCGGTGEVATMESVYKNEPHQALVGSQPCPDCRNTEPDDFSGATEGDR